MTLKTPLETEERPLKRPLTAMITLIGGSEYAAEIALSGEMNVEQKFLARLQADGGLWVDDADADDAKAFIPWHAITMVHFGPPEKRSTEPAV
jgi:hypothetical protein